MEQASGLTQTFLVHAKGRIVPSIPSEALEPLLIPHWEAARAHWPGVDLPFETFLASVAERLTGGSPPAPLEASLGQLSLLELYLTCACARGLAPALALFERHYLAKLRTLLRGPQFSDALLDEACQIMRVKLFVPSAEGGPRIRDYTGRGSLFNWVRIIMTRDAGKLGKGQKPGPEQDADLAFEALPAPGVNAEMDLFRRRHYPDFRRAVREAFSVLTNDERHLFRLHFLDRLSHYEMATLFRVNQSTVSRWVSRARLKVFEETQRLLQARLGLSTRDFKSFLAALDSQLEAGISQLLREDDGGVPG